MTPTPDSPEGLTVQQDLGDGRAVGPTDPSPVPGLGHSASIPIADLPRLPKGRWYVEFGRIRQHHVFSTIPRNINQRPARIAAVGSPHSYRTEEVEAQNAEIAIGIASLPDLIAVAKAAAAYRAAESDGTPRMWRGKALQDLADSLDDALGALAQGIEAQRAEAQSGSVVDESPVSEGNAPK